MLGQYSKVAIIDFGNENKFEHTYRNSNINNHVMDFKILDLNNINFTPTKIYIQNSFGETWSPKNDTGLGLCEIGKDYTVENDVGSDTYTFFKDGNYITLRSRMYKDNNTSTYIFIVPKIIAIG